jgi:3-dehydroquinate synthase
MKLTEIKVKNPDSNYSIFIGFRVLKLLPGKINSLCPNAKKIGLVVDKKVPEKFVKNIKKQLKKYEIYVFKYTSNEKLKSFKNVNQLAESCLDKNFTRSDVLLALGGGIVGDFSAFTASVIKRGINFVNIPTTLLSQVDSSIGGKTGVNSKYGKNLIGSFYQPKLVVTDVELLKSLPKREIVCGYAEILKHSLIADSQFFKWLEINSDKILEKRQLAYLIQAIKKSCKIKHHFVSKDFKEKNIRMCLNFGHTFAHAIESKNRYSKKINHGEAVLMGMMLASKLSYLKKIINKKDISRIINLYEKNKLNYRLDKFFKKKYYSKIIKFMNNDKKNNDKKINLILLRKIGKTTEPGKFKMTIKEINSIFSKII